MADHQLVAVDVLLTVDGLVQVLQLNALLVLEHREVGSSALHVTVGVHDAAGSCWAHPSLVLGVRVIVVIAARAVMAIHGWVHRCRGRHVATAGAVLLVRRVGWVGTWAAVVGRSIDLFTATAAMRCRCGVERLVRLPVIIVLRWLVGAILCFGQIAVMLTGASYLLITHRLDASLDLSSLLCDRSQVFLTDMGDRGDGSLLVGNV